MAKILVKMNRDEDQRKQGLLRFSAWVEGDQRKRADGATPEQAIGQLLFHNRLAQEALDVQVCTVGF